MKEVVITSKVVGREGAGVPAKIGQGSTVDLSAYLLKAIWDKVWEIRTDSTGKEYIFGKLPVVTQYGITMYAGDGGDIDLPSLYAGLPIDNTTIYWENGVLKAVGSSGGGGVADSVAWANVYGKPSWITDTKPTYAYSEITGTPDLSKYALQTDIPSLSGYATEQWVLNKGYALDANLDSLATIVDDKANRTELAKYIPISGYTEVSGEKNFVGGLKVNGSPIVYDATNKYWKLEGDLLVTGGVTMYANEGTYTPSTIMDALLYDDTTLGINSEGKLYVKGGTGGGLDITALQNYLTQNSYLNVTEGDGRYLKLSGGTIASSIALPLIIKTSSYTSGIQIHNSGGSKVFLGWNEINGVHLFNYSTSSSLKLHDNGNLYYNNDVILHAGNYSSYALPLSGGTINGQLTISRYPSTIAFVNAQKVPFGHMGYSGVDNPVVYMSDGATVYSILHTGNYSSYALPLSGGVIERNDRNLLLLRNTDSESASVLWFSGAFESFTEGAQIAYNNKQGSFTFGNHKAYTNNKKGLAGIRITSDNKIQVGDINFTDGYVYNIWHAGNHGEGSGLSADLLDGQHGSWYQSNVIAFRRRGATAVNEYDANIGVDAMLYNYGSASYWKNAPTGMSYGQILTLRNGDGYSLAGQLAWDVVHASTTDTTSGLWWRATDQGDWIEAKWHRIAFLESNVASSTKLQTARTIWGQSFDGTGNVSGNLFMNYNSDGIYITDNSIYWHNSSNAYVTRLLNFTSTGNVGIGTADPAYKLDVNGEIYSGGTLRIVPKSGTYTEGIRIQPYYDWSVLMLLGSDATASGSGTTINSWGIFNNNGNFYINRNGSATNTGYELCNVNGNWGIGKINPSYKLDVAGIIRSEKQVVSHTGTDMVQYLTHSNSSYAWNYTHRESNGYVWHIGVCSNTGGSNRKEAGAYEIRGANGSNNAGIFIRYQTSSHGKLVVANGNGYETSIGYLNSNIDTMYPVWTVGSGIGGDNKTTFGWWYSNVGYKMYLDTSGNLLTVGAITMYSDQRKKTILRNVELSLKQIANAPLIEHYYNSDDKKTTHVGSIAQYWASLNDWFCKLDNEGYYTMEIQNAALASAISVARELDRYETKTDKTIKKLKKRICELEEEVERLKAN